MRRRAKGHRRTAAVPQSNDGERVAARVGQPIVGKPSAVASYGEPKVSSASVRFDTSSFPPMHKPGGPTQIYRFTAAEEGGAKIAIGANPTFTLTIQVIAP